MLRSTDLNTLDITNPIYSDPLCPAVVVVVVVVVVVETWRLGPLEKGFPSKR